jgi:hypothetical protein
MLYLLEVTMESGYRQVKVLEQTGGVNSLEHLAIKKQKLDTLGK